MRSRGSSTCSNALGAFLVLSMAYGAAGARASTDLPVWPAPPDTARVAYVDALDLQEFKLQQGFFGSVLRTLGGRSELDHLGLPFDVVRMDDRLYLTCQNIPALVEVFPEEGAFKLHGCDDRPPVYPIGLCRLGRGILLSDSEQGVVYRFEDGQLAPFIVEGLERPTGLAVVQDRIFVVDTGAHAVHVFDAQGNPLGMLQGADSLSFHFPTFAVAAQEELLINDSLNYRIRRFRQDGSEVAAFGKEGDGPGSFARPKDIAVDGEGHVYVVDNLFDNIQVFDPEGTLLLIIGGQGNGPGEFWSPGGLDIVDDLVYVADTYNHRIQILRYLGGS